MTNNVLLNNVDHKNVKIIRERSERFGDDVMFARTFPVEFRTVQAHYPIFFHKDPNTAEFYPVAMFGFQEKENLFLSDKGWDASYVPLMIQRQPFLIGVQNVQDEGASSQQRVLHIDMDSPRVSETEGEPLFLEFGGNTPYLERMANMMETIHHALQDNKTFMAVLLKHELIESFSLNIELNDRTKNQLLGFYTVNEERIKQLDTETLLTLRDTGYLEYIYMVIASQGQIRKLVDKKNAQLIQ